MTLVAGGDVRIVRPDENVRPGVPRLGRHLELDGRSLAHMVENSAALMTASPTRSRAWDRPTPILDQGRLGSCTGNAFTGALGTEPLYSAVGRDLQLDEDFAVQYYADETVIDGYPGTWPPDDTGSSGLAGCRVAKARHYVRRYRWARTPHGFLRLLQTGVVLIGMPWYEAFFTPDRDGFIDSDPRWSASGVAGGHEVEALEVDLDERDVFSSVVTVANSWGAGWGVAGYFHLRLRLLEQLSDVDLKQLVTPVG